MTSIKVAIKVRPLIQREKEENKQSLWTVVDEKTIRTHNREHSLTFDKIFDETKSTQELFDSVAKPIISSAIEGINGTIFAYGQTSSGKTYCMMGTEETPGIVPLTAAEIFKQIENIQGHEFLIRIGYIEIYNEKVFDLLDPNKCEIIKCRENLRNEVMLDQTEIVVMRPDDILEKYNQGNNNRRVEETSMNDQSSRSHALFRIVIESKKEGTCGVVKVSTIFLVDLAGSERASQTKASGDRLREGGHINKSLLWLSKIIRELGNAGESKKHINFRDSKLTRILSTSLGGNGGNAQTAIICTITPVNIEESLSTFTFASNAKKVKTLPKVNEVLSDEVLMQRMQKEIAGLKSKLEKETAKNSEEAIQARIREQIFEREVAFIHSGLPYVEKENRRRTWVCPGATVNEAIVSKSTNVLRPPKNQFLAPPPPFVIPRDIDHNGDGNVRFFDHEYPDEVFRSSNDVNLDRTLSPMQGRTTDELTNLIHTPRSLLPKAHFANSPNIDAKQDPYERIIELENELMELQDYKFLEENTKISGEEIQKMQAKIDNTNVELSRCESTIDDLQVQMKEKDEILSNYKTQLQLAQNESKKSSNERMESESRLAGIQFELELVKNKAKNRESELLSFVEDARQEAKVDLLVNIKSLEEALKNNEENMDKSTNNSDADKRIKELEDEILLFRDDRQSMKETIKELEDVQLKLSSEAMDAIEETEKLNKELTEFKDKLSNYENLQKNLDTLQEENQRLNTQVADAIEKSARFEKIQEVLKSGNENLTEEDFDDDDDIGKLILKLHHDAAKKDTLEVEKLQLMKDFDEIRQTVVDLSEKLVASQAAIEGEPQMRNQIEILSAELVATKNQLSEKSSDHETRIDELMQQLEILNRENSNMAATLKECESLEADVELLNIQKQQRDDKIDELILKIEQLNEKVLGDDKSTSMEDDFLDVNAVAKFNEEKLSLESEVQKLIIKNQLIEKDLGASNITISELLEKLSLNQTVIDDMNEKLSNKDQLMNSHIELSDTNAALNDLQIELESLKTVVLEKDKQIEILREEILEHQQDYEKLKDKYKEYEIQLTEKDNKICELVEERESPKQLQEEIKAVRKEMDELNTNNSKLQRLLNDAKKIEEDLWKQIDEAESEDIELLSKNEVLSQQVETLTRSNTSFVLAIQELESKEIKLEKLTELKEAKISELSSKLQEFEQTLSNNKQSMTDEEKTTFEHEKLKLKEENEKVEKQNQQLEDRIKQLEDQFGKSEAVCDELQNQLNTNKTSIEDLHKTIDDHKKKLAKNKALIEDTQHLLDDCQKELIETKSQLSGEIKKVRNFEEEVEHLQNACKEKQLQVSKFEEENLNLKAALEQTPSSTEKLLNETQEMKAKLSKLKIKIQEIETDRNTKHNSLSELTQKYSKIQAEHTKAEAHNNEVHEKELSEMKASLTLMEAECTEAKNRLRRRSKDNTLKVQELETINNGLVQRLGEIEAMKVNTDAEMKRLREEQKKTSEENDVKFSEFRDMNRKLEAQLKALSNNEMKFKSEIEKLNSELVHQMSQNFISNQTISELRQKCEDLTEQLNSGSVVKKVSTSPTNSIPRRSNEHEDETFALQHKKLICETNAGTPVRAQRSIIERKTRRQSVVDDRRRLSVWEKNLSVETQTDKNSDECACCELRLQVNQLKTQIRVNDCKISNFERLSKIAKADLKQAELDKEREKREQARAKENYDLEIASLQKKIKSIKAEADKMKERPRVTRASQTVSPQVDKSIADEVQKEKEALERKVIDLEKKLRRFEEEKNIAEKENINQNVQNSSAPASVGNSNSITQGGNSRDPTLDETLRKYDMAKRLCTMRNESIEKLNKENEDLNTYNQQMRASYQLEMRKAFQENAELKASYENVKFKYERARDICDMRLNKLQALRQKYGEPDPSEIPESTTPEANSAAID